jgi:uncharacterized membrane protein
MLQLFLVLHVLGAIIAFGPSAVFAVIGAMSAKEPMHANFAARLSERLETRLVIPFALTMPITGALLIYYAQLDLTNPTSRWLVAGIILYVIALTYAILVQTPAAKKMVELTAAAGAAAAAARANPPAAGGPPAAPPGPPPELLATAKKLQRGGMFLTVMIVAIVILMVTKPGF